MYQQVDNFIVIGQNPTQCLDMIKEDVTINGGENPSEYLIMTFNILNDNKDDQHQKVPKTV